MASLRWVFLAIALSLTGCAVDTPAEDASSSSSEESELRGGRRIWGEAARLKKAKSSLLRYWENDFVKTDAWTSNLDGRTWAQVKTQVEADVAAFETSDSYEVYREATQTIFVSRVYGLHTEITISETGATKNIYVEID
jgi:hypothetical protein